jgi:ArsR family transcriptional regulator
MDLPALFRALGDPTRLRIVNLLLEGPGCVCEMEAVLQIPQPLVSRHLAYLRGSGLVTDRRQGMRVNYSLRLDDPAGANLTAHLKGTFARDAQYRREAVRWSRLRGTGFPGAARAPARRLRAAAKER